MKGNSFSIGKVQGGNNGRVKNANALKQAKSLIVQKTQA